MTSMGCSTRKPYGKHSCCKEVGLDKGAGPRSESSNTRSLPSPYTISLPMSISLLRGSVQSSMDFDHASETHRPTKSMITRAWPEIWYFMTKQG